MFFLLRLGVAYVQFHITKYTSHLSTKTVFRNTRIKYKTNILLPVVVIGKLFTASRAIKIVFMLAFWSCICKDGWKVVGGITFEILWNNGVAPYIFVSTGLLTPGNKILFCALSNFETWPLHLTWSIRFVTPQSLCFNTSLDITCA